MADREASDVDGDLELEVEVEEVDQPPPVVTLVSDLASKRKS